MSLVKLEKGEQPKISAEYLIFTKATALTHNKRLDFECAGLDLVSRIVVHLQFSINPVLLLKSLLIKIITL